MADEDDDDRLYDNEEENSELGDVAEYDEEPDEFAGVAEDAAGAFEELDKDTAKAAAGQNPLADEDEDQPGQAEPPAAPPPVRPFAQQQQANGGAAQPTPQAPATAPAQTVYRAPATQPGPAGGTQVQLPVKDQSGQIVGYQMLDAAGNVTEEYAIDAAGNRLSEKPYWVNDDGTRALTDEAVSEHVGLKVTLAAGAGLVGGWILKALWDRYQKQKRS